MGEKRDDGDVFAAGGAEAGQASEYEGYSYQAPNPYAAMGSIDPATLSPMFGGTMHGGRSGAIQPEYLYYEPKSWIERMFYNSGSAYLIGIGTGGTYGVINGLQSSPSPKFKIRVNTILNKSGRFGSRFGNALGAVAMMYSCFEAVFDRYEVERYFGGDDFFNPILAATATGLLYKSTQGPKTMALAALIGGGAAASLVGARKLMTTRGSGAAMFN